MAEITKGGTPSLTGPLPVDSDRLPPMYAGEVLEAGDAGCVRADGFVWRTDGTATGVFATTAQVHGMVQKKTGVGERVSLYQRCDMAYAAGLVPGTFVYASTTVKGGLANTPGAQNPEPCGLVCTADAPDTRQRIRFFPTNGRALV